MVETHTVRVLVVDDDAVARSVMSAMLEEAGFEIRAVADGRTALDVLAMTDWRPQVMVLDYVLPGLDGAQVLDAMQAMEGLEPISVIVVTASVERIPERVRSAVPVVTKSAGLTGLIAAIKGAAGKKAPARLLHKL
jgi:CheY-like chemotaxis protein